MSDAVDQLDEEPRAAAVDFLARLGAAMLAASYEVVIVRRVLTHAADRFQVDNGLLVFPDFIVVGEGGESRIERVTNTMRFDQIYQLGDLARATERGYVTAESGSVELTRILALPRPLPAWVNVIGYTIQSTAYGLILQPTPNGLIVAAGFGLLVGVLDVLSRASAGMRQLLPFICAFVVTLIAFSLGRWLDLGQDSLRILIAPLTLFLPGVGITMAISEAASGEMISAAARFTQAFTRLAQLALGIVLAVQILGLSKSELTDVPDNTLGSWAPWLGVAVYGVGIMLYNGPPRRFLPWLLIVLFVAYASQLATAAVFGSYASGFGGGLALMLCALALSQLRSTPSTQVMLSPGFWLMVPSSVGLVGIAELVGGESGGAIAVMLVSMLSIALGFQAGRAVWDVIHAGFRRRNEPL